ncbi:MAG: J domain-containing protein [Chloroflexaceae bacterium]|nr:J domain-containing protein [Chloroflexaceae bacterium]
MRIPLDYYKILVVPVEASAEQLERAYHDRIQQLPRGDYGEVTLSARQQLLEDAYQVLVDSERRKEYNAKFFEVSEEASKPALELPPTGGKFASKSIIDRGAPWIEISQDQLGGALVILQELGEYELVLRIGQPYLNRLQASTPTAAGAPPASKLGETWFCHWV